jgi:hypothetical protein
VERVEKGVESWRYVAGVESEERRGDTSLFRVLERGGMEVYQI